MVFQIISINALIRCLQVIRFILNQIMILQRLPFLFAAVFFMSVGRLSYHWLGWHQWYVQGFKWTLRMALFFRGIRLQIDSPSNYRWASGIHICNDAPWVSIVLLAHSPYRHLVICPNQFFKWEALRSMAFLLGFYPPEHGFRPENIQHKESRLSPYIKAGFGIWQPVMVEYRDTEPLPYAVIMAIKHECPLHIWKLHAVEGLDMVHWLRPRRIKMCLINQVAISPRHALTVSAYYHTIGLHFGPPLTQTMSRMHSAPGMPPKNKDLAKQTIADAKQRSAEWESEFRTQ